MTESKHSSVLSNNVAVDFEEQLLKYQKRIANILESFTDAFFEVDEKWIVTYWNKEAERLLLMPRAEIIGKNLWEVYQDAIPLKFYQEYHRAVEQNVSVRFQEYFAPRQLWLEVAAFPSGNGLSVYFKDITASKEATALLVGERRKYSDLFNLSPVPQWVYDLDTLSFLDVNQAAIAHYGYSRHEFLAMTIKDIRPEDDIHLLEEALCTEVLPGFFSKSTVRHTKKNGEIIFVCVEGNTVFFEGKNARLVMVVDRSAEVAAQVALEESVKRYNIVSKATSDAIWDLNILTGEITWNRGIKGIFGHDESSYSFKWWQKHIHPEDLDLILQKINSFFEIRESKLEMEYRFLCADGSYRSVLDRAFIVFDEAGNPVRIIGSMQDISERVRALRAIEAQNAQLREISWIQSHKVRSPLARILGLVSLIDHSKNDLMTVAEVVPLLKSSAEQLDQILKEILEKARA